jgi:hypothetical protein
MVKVLMDFVLKVLYIITFLWICVLPFTAME